MSDNRANCDGALNFVQKKLMVQPCRRMHGGFLIWDSSHLCV
jgi:hypothetical protein